MSGLARQGYDVELLDTGRIPHGLGVERVYLPDMFRNPNQDWPVQATPLVVADGVGGSGSARKFQAGMSSGVAFHIRIPEGAEKILLRIPYRAATLPAAESSVCPRLYSRVSDDQEWDGPSAIGVLRLPPNDLYQAATFPLMLRPFKLEGGMYAQFLFVRDPESRSDTLETDWHLFGLGVTFV